MKKLSMFLFLFIVNVAIGNPPPKSTFMVGSPRFRVRSPIGEEAKKLEKSFQLYKLNKENTLLASSEQEDAESASSTLQTANTDLTASQKADREVKALLS